MDERRAISLKLTVTARQMHKGFDHNVAAIGITRSQWALVAVVSRRPGITQREVAEILEMSEASAGRLVDRLCTDGIVVRQPKEDDRRAHCIHLTDAASDLQQRIGSIAENYERAVFAGFSREDLAQFAAFLDKVATNVVAIG